MGGLPILFFYIRQIKEAVFTWSSDSYIMLILLLLFFPKVRKGTSMMPTIHDEDFYLNDWNYIT